MRIPKTVVASLCGVLLLVVLAYFYLIYAPDPVLPNLDGQIRNAAIKVGARERTFVQYVPARLPVGAPLVIVLHGSTMDGAQMRKWTGYEFDSLADAHGFAVFYPDAYKHNWNDCRKAGHFPAKTENIDDIGFVRALVAQAVAQLKVAPGKVYLVGYSNGGQMAMTLATSSPSPAAGIAVFGANLPTPNNSACSQVTPTPPVMITDGTADPLNPYLGGEVSIFGFQHKGTAMSAPATAMAFAHRNGLTADPIVEMLPHRDRNDPTSVQRQTWLKRGTPYVVFNSIHAGGHTVPQPAFRYPRLLGPTSGDIDGPKAAIAFFRL